MDAEKDIGRPGRLLHLGFIAVVAFLAIVVKPPGHFKGSGSELVDNIHGWNVGTIQGAFVITLLAITLFYLRRSAAIASDNAEDVLLLASVNLFGLGNFFSYMLFNASMWGLLVVAAFLSIRRTRREQSDVALKWDRARGGRLVLLVVVFAATWPSIFLSPPGLFKDTGYIRSSPIDDHLAEWKVSLKECYDNLHMGELVATCHPYYGLYAASMNGAFMVSSLSIMVSYFHRFGAVARDTTKDIFIENVLLLLGVNSLGLGFYIRQLVVFGEKSFMAIPEQMMIFAVSMWVVLNVAPVTCLLASWRGLRRDDTCRLPFPPKATKSQPEQLTACQPE